MKYPAKSFKRFFYYIVTIVIALYILLHFALVPIFSLTTNYTHRKCSTPKNWGLSYSKHTVESDWGIEMPGWYIPGHENMPIIIVLTGSGGCKYGTITKFPTLFLHEEGYNVFLVDTRGQGYSSGIKTFGIGEAVDLVHIVNYLSQNFPDKKIGAIGFSLGAASILRAAGMDQRISAAVSYSSYAEIDHELINQELRTQSSRIWKSLTCERGRRDSSKECKESTEFVSQSVNIFVSSILLRFSLKLWSGTFWPIPSPKESLANFGNKSVLLMHNNKDPEIGINNVKELYNVANANHKKLFTIPYQYHHPPFKSNPVINKENNLRFRTFFKNNIQNFFNNHLK